MKIVHCHGTFGMLHLGHIRHLEQARALGDWLVVTITADACNRKQRNLLFKDVERQEMIRALRCVQWAFIVRTPDSIPAIKLVKPDIYCKGIEYMGRLKEQAYCERNGIKVVFTNQNGWSSLDPAAHTSALLKQ